MRIDWFTLVAQIFNFVLLVYLLKRFLYRPILDAVDRREQSVKQGLEEARRKSEEASEEAARVERLRQELEGSRAERLRATEEAAEARRQELTAEIREEVRTMRTEWHESLRRHKEAFLEELGERLSRELYDLVERVLGELADTEIEDRLIDVFLERLPESGEAERDDFVKTTLQEGSAQVCSSFPLAETRRREIATAIRSWAGRELPLSWKEDPGRSLGVELRAGDRKIAWSVDHYLEALRTETALLLEAESR